MHRNRAVRNLPIFDSRSTPREGDGSPILQMATEEKRTPEARILYGKNAERQKRRAYKKAGEKGLEKYIAHLQAQRGYTESNTEQDLDGAPVKPLARKKATSKPARRSVLRKPAAKVRRVYHPEIIERKKSRALLRDIKRAFKKALMYAARQSKEYGYSFCLVILELFFLRLKNLIAQNFQEAS